MKKLSLFILILSILCSVFVIGCSNETYDKNEEENAEKHKEDKDKTDKDETDKDETPEEKKINAFLEYLIASEYAKAIDYYQSDLSGNYELETGAQEQILLFCEEINAKTLSGDYTEKQVNTKLGVVQKVVEGIDVYPDGYEEVVIAIEGSLASKSAFTAAQNLEELKNYIDAAEEYQKVVENDSNYATAQEGAERCIELYKTDVLEDAKASADTEDYLSAIRVLKAAAEKLPEDSDIQAKLTVYEKTYITLVLAAAEEAFVVPATDYSKALEIINAALQHYPENEELNTKKTSYQSFAPVYLYDMGALRGGAERATTDTDTYGNSYQKCFRADTNITFNLNKNYNTFSAVVYGLDKSNTGDNASVRVYADGKIVYEKLNMPDNKIQPFTIDLNVTGVSELRIYLDGYHYGDIGMTEMIVQKTVK